MAKALRTVKAKHLAKKGVGEADDELSGKHAIKNEGSSFESFLEEEGILDDVDKQAIKRLTEARAGARRNRAGRD